MLKFFKHFLQPNNIKSLGVLILCVLLLGIHLFIGVYSVYMDTRTFLF